MKKIFKELVSDANEINEQSFVGVVAFFAMVFILIVDVVTGIWGKELVIKEFIFDGFMIITLGAFGITTAGKVLSHKKNKKDEDNQDGESGN
jgi:membrane-anchored glycerophosphoryl diester phosphodiesterase (GDPDase)